MLPLLPLPRVQRSILKRGVCPYFLVLSLLEVKVGVGGAVEHVHGVILVNMHYSSSVCSITNNPGTSSAYPLYHTTASHEQSKTNENVHFLPDFVGILGECIFHTKFLLQQRLDVFLFLAIIVRILHSADWVDVPIH